MVRIASTMIFNTLQRNGYPFVPLSELAENPQYGYTAKSFEDGIEGVNPHLVRITDLQDDKIEWRSVPYCESPNSAQYLLKPNDILFARTGATTGKTHLIKEVPSPAVFASYLIRIRPRDRVFAGYLYAFFQSDNYWSQIIEQKQGSAQPNVNGQKLASLFLPQIKPELQLAIFSFIQAVRKRQDGDSIELPSLPDPLSEQRRIVAKIEQLATKIEEARRLRQQSEAIVSFLLIQGIKKLLQPTANWRKSTISDCSLLSTGTTPPSHREEYFGGKIQWYTPGDLGFEKNLSRSSRTITELAVRDNKARLFEPGTILLVAIGGSLGKVGLTTEICSSNQQITGIKFVPEVDAEFGFWWLRSRYHELRNAAPEATLPILNQRRLGAISFSYPSLDEQRRIVAYLDGLQAQVNRLKALQAQTVAELEALLPSILDRAFKGEL